MANAVLAHYFGDETATASDITDLQTVLATIPLLGAALQGVWQDISPSDNNITIDLNTGATNDN